MSTTKVSYFLIGAVVACAVILGNLPSTVTAAGPSLYMSPSSGTYYTGQTITVSLKANTNGENTNAVQADFTYPTSKLQYLSIDSSGSAYAIDASSSGGGGSVSIARGNIANVNSSAALIAKVKFKILSSTGTATLNYSGSSALVRSSDSQDILNATSGASYTIKVKTTSTDTTKPKTDTTTAPKPTDTNTDTTDTTDEKQPDEKNNSDDKEETPAATTDDDNNTNLPENNVKDVSQEKPKSEKLFLGLSNSTAIAVLLPLLIAILAIGTIYWRKRHSLLLPSSNHNFEPKLNDIQPSSPIVETQPIQSQLPETASDQNPPSQVTSEQNQQPQPPQDLTQAPIPPSPPIPTPEPAPNPTPPLEPTPPTPPLTPELPNQPIPTEQTNDQANKEQ